MKTGVLHEISSSVMASKNHRRSVVGYIIFIIALSHISSNGFIEGSRVSIKENTELVHKENKTIVVSI